MKIKMKTKTISLTTEQGYKQAERLKDNGWRVKNYNAGSDTIVMEKNQ